MTHVKYEKFKAGEYICKQDEPSNGKYYVIFSGRVGIVERHKNIFAIENSANVENSVFKMFANVLLNNHEKENRKKNLLKENLFSKEKNKNEGNNIELLKFNNILMKNNANEVDALNSNFDFLMKYDQINSDKRNYEYKKIEIFFLI